MTGLKQAAATAGIPYPTAAGWVAQGLLQPEGYKGLQGAVIPWNAKLTRELCILTRLREVLSMQALRDALAYLRKLGHNPLSSGRFAVVGGPPSKRRLIKLCDETRAIELLGKSRGQLLLIPLVVEGGEPRKKRSGRKALAMTEG